ncbi:MAG: uroporphyrinogen-III synthase [Moraxellaceae bacterium]|nr:uroporphyrinogen-III synthase [Moraxellaceae bacterium]
MTSLSGLHILNTRPAHQSGDLSAALRAAGATVSELPLIAITPLALPADAERLLLDLDRFNGVFFVSANAARLALDAVAGFWPQWPYRLPAYAVGQRTAVALEDAGLTVITPEQADSEGLLALPELAEVSGQRFLLLRGESGRELLADTLRARGAQVEIIGLYRRDLPADACQQWQALTPSTPDVIVLTSPDALRHWQQVAGPDAIAPHWLVVSPRLQALAADAGARATVAAGADTASLLQALASLPR